jgi:lambda family phage portal protein
MATKARSKAAAGKSFPGTAVSVAPGKELAMGGALEGAERTSRETVNWRSTIRSPDQIINPLKRQADARGQDMERNDGKTQGVSALHKDSIVGSYFRLSAKPSWRILGADESWAADYQAFIEEYWGLIAESGSNWLDAAGQLSFTEMIRLQVGVFFTTGENIYGAEWIKDDPLRPIKTAASLVAPARLSNPQYQMDTDKIRGGVEIDGRGKPVAYHIQNSYPTEFYRPTDTDWKRIPAQLRWGRKQVIHIKEPRMPGQNRGISDMVAVLKETKMGKLFKEIVLQKAVVQASYAAALQSEIPPQILAQAMGADPHDLSSGFMNMIGAYMSMLGTYFGNAENVNIDGAQFPVLPPGVKLNLQSLSAPGGLGDDFNTALDRNIAAALGISYEEYTGDFSKTNYSSAKKAGAKTERFMSARKMLVADKGANELYALAVEELWMARKLPRMRRWGDDKFYEPLMKEAMCKASWIGTGQGQVDEEKETNAAALRIATGLSTLEDECARLGKDYREVLAQRSREMKLLDELDLELSTNGQNSSNNASRKSDAGNEDS